MSSELFSLGNCVDGKTDFVVCHLYCPILEPFTGSDRHHSVGSDAHSIVVKQHIYDFFLVKDCEM